MKLIKITILLLITALSFTSCDEYLDVNGDVNNPPAESITPELILPAAQNGAVSALVGTQNRFGTTMMNQWAGDVTNFTGGNDDEYNFNINNTFYSGIWNNMYLTTDKLQAIINKNSAENVYFTAIATILKAHNMQYIVDMYGNAPYSEAFQRGENYQPAYDDAREVYKELVASLDNSIAMINGAGIEAKNPGTSDVMLNGDMDKWIRFANTLKLKLLVRASSSSDADMQSFVASSFATLNGVNFLGAGDNISSNPGYAADTAKQNPFWNTYGFLTDGSQTTTNQFIVGSEHFINQLILTGDTRISKFFTLASGSGTYQGIEQGADDPDDPSIGLSYIGDGLLSSATQDAWFFTAAESLFLQAEAAMNGHISGNALDLFQSGITESFNLLGLGADAAGYIASNASTITLENIMTQKWIALHATDGLETYIEHNRTGFPNPPLPTLTTDSHRPYRLMYPQSEFVGNSANVIAISRADVFVPSLFYQH